MRRIIIFSAFVFTALGLNAQNFEAKLIGGVVASQINGDGVAGYNKFGLVGGAATNFYSQNKENWSFQQEITYHMRGSHSSPQQPGSWAIRMNYVDVSMLVNYYFSDQLFIQVGPSGGYLLSARSGFGNTFGDMDYVRPFDIAANAGAGYMLNENTEVNLRILYSMLGTATDRWWFHHNSIALSLRYVL